MNTRNLVELIVRVLYGKFTVAENADGLLSPKSGSDFRRKINEEGELTGLLLFPNISWIIPSGAPALNAEVECRSSPPCQVYIVY